MNQSAATEGQVPAAPATPATEDDIGTCLVIVDEATEVVCGDPGVIEVLVRNKFALFSVALCNLHASRHRDFYERRRKMMSELARRPRFRK